ncbi:crossover junction endodeoxyribonuclease RuvC [[Clostridium] fimetarium]|uniref:Crossover junction endodeoxyribonuclease RuvC n=1 Tax=[Clostridium] fimetarium TaxID=99656 RepID=A0A1I0QWB4_9FIRM|nr:crossover junction endodeoxyribonuclease RuvC [[Clostridium] fimetarium]SEW31724.1 Crossover junction endodeoxyribonuclease RuvC [[Clostridium] fimetarium]
MIERKNEKPPEHFPIEFYRSHPSTMSNNTYVIGLDSGTMNAAIVVAQVIKEYHPKRNYYKIVEFIYPEKEMRNLTSDEKLLFLANLIWDLCMKYNVLAITFEMLPLTTVGPKKLKGVLLAHSMTAITELICACLDIKHCPIPVTTIKYYVTKNGDAKKEQVQQCVDKLLEYQYSDIILGNDHIADALAVLHTYMCLYFQKDVKQE